MGGNRISKVLEPLISKNEISILIIGLDHAGKTTLLHKMKLGEIKRAIPLIAIYIDTIKYKTLTFNSLYSSRKMPLPFWRPYFQNNQAVIYIVDSTDRERMDEAKELLKLLDEDALKDSFLLVFANKQDLPNALNAVEISELLGLHSLERSWYVQETCILKNQGVYEGFERVTDFIISNGKGVKILDDCK